ncbi:hypothetical protein L6J37_13955 [Photobacterium sp. WH77]|uniref:hypothetical protein n=1 Tax=unclassified Photobacterium TaxID=2628852 RepID=UPI001EDB37B6|nr:MULTISPECIES: hypothetical protein [unclassified Photobacterium]MCG2837937.1 hypothetical protein [Photobacterium sp. WH77]MCG2845555.1 hypothetical protein [Photobacterium sp. WH80]
MTKTIQQLAKEDIKRHADEPVTFERIPRSKLLRTVKKVMTDHKETIKELADR